MATPRNAESHRHVDEVKESIINAYEIKTGQSRGENLDSWR
jgi:hypothetical protein